MIIIYRIQVYFGIIGSFAVEADVCRLETSIPSIFIHFDIQSYRVQTELTSGAHKTSTCNGNVDSITNKSSKYNRS